MTPVAVDADVAQLLVESRAGDERAKEELLLQFMPLVRRIASRYVNRGEPLDDLVQVGSIGLLNAMNRFDPSRGVQFSTYAVPTIVGEIKRYFRDKSWAVHVPRHLKEQSLYLGRLSGTMTADLGRAPTVAELAHESGLDEETVVEALEAGNAYTARSLSRPLAQGSEDETFEDLLGDADPGFENVEDGALIEVGLSALDERERRIVELRFFDGLTQSEIAATVGISQMHVSRLLRHALSLMRGRLDDPAGGSG